LDGALCLGVTVLTGSPLKDAMAQSQRAKASFPHLPIVWGGWHPSLFPTDTLRDAPYVDVTVQGQGELTFQDLVDAWANGKELAGIQGICYRKPDGEIQQNAARALVNMDDLPPADYSLIRVEDYFAKKGRRQLDYISSTGCYFRCTFCADPFVFNRKWSAISPPRMGRELAELHQKYGFNDLNFQDETFFTYPKRVKEIAEELVERKVRTSWAGTLRADQASRISDEDFAFLVQSGLRRVLIGVESGSQEMMNWLKKDIKMEQVLEAADRCRKLGVSVIFPFIVGFPNESDQSVADTVKMVKHLSGLSDRFDTPIFYFKPYPGTQITFEAEKNGYQLPQNIGEWADFDYIGSSGPWVSPQKYQFFERFKFYNKLAKRSSAPLLAPLRWLARARLKNDQYSLPWEKWVIETVRPKQRLS
jgi:radical SAM superfamily enzyme YgiQ (UPF0313 family)